MNQLSLNNRQHLSLLRELIAQRLKDIKTEYGVTLTVGNCKYSDTTATFKLEAAVPNATGEVESKEHIDYRLKCQWYNLKPEWLDKQFTSMGRTYTLIGLRTTARTMPCIARRDDGKVFKMPEWSVKNAFELVNK